MLQPLPHPRILVIVIGQSVELAPLQEVRSLVVILVVDQAAVVRVVILRQVERLDNRNVRRIAGVHLRPTCMVQIHVDDGFHLPFVQEHNELPKLGLGAVLGVHHVEVLGPVAVVPVRHLLHDRRQGDPVDAERLQVAEPLPYAGEVAAAVVVHLLAPHGRRRGEAVDQNLIHGDLRPRPRAPRQVVPGRRGVPLGPIQA
mmetsp:Transcript_43123/g.130306  ORF Transcript_43123/g.130306 Transcript_43123/m.130306 type:complete len:200 (+) Transcript_43123:1662-2261(+)